MTTSFALLPPLCNAVRMQNLPAPASDIEPSSEWDPTTTVDYQRVRFYQRAGSSSSPRRAARQVERMWAALAHCYQSPVGIYERTVTADATSQKAGALASWLALDWPVEETLPLRYVALGADLSRDVIGFCAREGLMGYLSLAADFVVDCFGASIQGIAVNVENDPESGDEWLSLELTLSGDSQGLLARYDSYVSRWVASVPPAEQGKIRVCLYG